MAILEDFDIEDIVNGLESEDVSEEEVIEWLEGLSELPEADDEDDFVETMISLFLQHRLMSTLY